MTTQTLEHRPSFPGMPPRPAPLKPEPLRYEVTYVENEKLTGGDARLSLGAKEEHATMTVLCDDITGDYGTVRFFRGGLMVALFPTDRVVRVTKID